MELFWRAFSAYAGLELQMEPFQHHFDDLVSFLVPLLHIFDALLLKTHIIIASRLAPSMDLFSFPSSPLERVRCVVEAAPQARPEDHLGGIFCSSFVAEYHLGLTSALQHCQHNGAFRFLAAQVFSIFGAPFWKFFELWWVKFGVFLELVSRSLFASIFYWNYWQLELWKQGFRVEGIAKTMFSQKLCFGDSRADFWCFLEALGMVFLIFFVLETGLKILCFSRSPWGSWLAPENKRTGGLMVKRSVWVGSNNLSTTSWVITLA